MNKVPFHTRFLAAVLDAAESSRSRRNLAFFGRENRADEDRLIPQSERDKVAARCHDLRRNNPIMAGSCDRIVDNVIGSKIRLQARTSDNKWNTEAELWMANWSAAVDPGMRVSLTEAAKLTVAARLYDGELFHLPRKDGQIEIIEAERVRPESKVVNGKPYQLEPSTGKVTAWRIHDRDTNGTFYMDHPERWEQGVIHCRRCWRPDQIRGWPDLATVANTITDLHEINVAQLKKHKMGALAAWIYKKGRSGGNLVGRNTATNSAGQPLHRFQEGQIYEIEEGAGLEPFLNNTPGAEYAPFIELNLRLVGMALGLPYEFLLMYFGGGSFASSKASLLQAYKTIDSWQSWLEVGYIHPVVAWRIAKAIRDRELPPAPVDSRGVSEWAKWEWQRPGVEWIDPQNAIQTEMQEVRMGASTMYDVCSRRGKDAEEVARQNARYLRMVNMVAGEEGVNPEQLHSIQIPGQTPINSDADMSPTDKVIEKENQRIPMKNE